MATMRAIGELSAATEWHIAEKTKRQKDSQLTSLPDIKGGKGPIENMFINPDTAIPKISSTQALVKVKAFGLNRMDLLQREGLYPLPPQAPETMGVEFSGTIEELAPGSEREFKKGDEVFGLAYGGAYAEYIAVSTHMLVKKPQELSWEEAAGIPEVSTVLVAHKEKKN